MLQPECGSQLTGQYALVSYIPGPLAQFLDELRLELTPGCNPHAHVTVLPPRPLEQDLTTALQEITEDSRVCAPFRVKLGTVEIFPKSNVIYMEIACGGDELRKLYESLNSGALAFEEPFPYHPHITIAQHLTCEEARQLADYVRDRWENWPGPREFEVTEISFVRNVAPTVWEDLTALPLSAEVPVGG